MSVLRRIAAFACAVLLSAVLGALIQTQYNLAALAALGVDIPAGIRLQTTAQDLLGFTPLYAAIVGIALLLAFPAAALLSRLLPDWRRLLYTLAGALAILVALALMNTALSITAIAATRQLSGLLALALAGGLGGLLFAILTSQKEGAGRKRPAPVCSD